jgi:hypothetical protein
MTVAACNGALDLATGRVNAAVHDSQFRPFY